MPAMAGRRRTFDPIGVRTDLESVVVLADFVDAGSHRVMACLQHVAYSAGVGSDAGGMPVIWLVFDVGGAIQPSNRLFLDHR